MEVFDILEIRRKLDKAILDISKVNNLESLHKAASLAPIWLSRHLELYHTIPSPSSILRCRRQLWLRAKGKISEEDMPVYWAVRQAIGTMQEPYWMAVFDTAGFKPTILEEPIQCGPYMKGSPDMVLDGDCILELKNINNFGYTKLLNSSQGISVVEPDHYAQIMCYLEGFGKDLALYCAVPAETNARTPPYYLEFIRRDNGYINFLMRRAEAIAEDLTKSEPPMKEYDGKPLDIRGKKTMPCGYCVSQAFCAKIDLGLEEGEHVLEWATVK